MKPPNDKKNDRSGEPPAATTAQPRQAGESAGKQQPGYYHAPPASEADQATAGFDPRMILTLVANYWWVILLFLVLGTSASVAFVLLETPKFFVRCKYQIYSERLLQVGTTSTQEAQTKRLSQQIILDSPVIRERVVQKLRPKWENRVADLKPEVEIKRGNPNTVKVITAKTENQDYGVAFLSELLKVYVEQREISELRAREHSLRGLRMEKRRLEDELRDARQRLVEFSKSHELKLARMEQELDQNFLDNLMNRANALQMERTMIELQLQALQGANAATMNDVLSLTMETHSIRSSQNATEESSPIMTNSGDSREGNSNTGQKASDSAKQRMVKASGLENVKYASQWRSLEQALAQLQTEYDQKLKQYKPGHPEMQNLRQRIAQVESSIQFESDIAKRRLEARHQALQVQESAIKELAKGWNSGKANLTLKEQAEYDNLKAEVSRLQKFANQITSRLIDVATKSSNPLITQMIEEPRALGKIWPRPVPIIGGSVVGSVGLAMALALGLMYFDRRFQNIMAIEQQLNLPFIGGIPQWQRVVKNLDDATEVVMDKKNPNAASESYRSLRIALDKEIPEDGPATLMITSCSAGEGKTVTTANLGISFGWVGKKILLIDADFRRPKLHDILGLENSKTGLTQLLQGKVESWRDLRQATVYDNVDFIPAGRFSLEATETCSSQVFKQILKECNDEYDLVILDTAPVGQIVETAIIARACDLTLMVARHGNASVPSMCHSLRRLEGCNVIGFCLNAIDIPKHHAYRAYRGYYGYNWRYGLYSYYYYYSDSLYGDEYYGTKQKDDAT